ncbi:two-component sensor histidine kinase [Actinomadura harenae]|uniref:histidine kinase n=2 Tax=Actinomadura harenae TaxID=2483351 RepID=A0A3M2M3A7_9ACTN|nr:two-component sensor histidine kinase [Actinomadura harenae]
MVVACAVGYLVLMRRPGTPHALEEWTIASASLGVLVAAVRWPLAAAFVQPVLLVLAARYGSGTPIVEKVAASIAVFEVTLRHDRREAALALTALAAGYTAMWAGEAAQDMASLAYKGTVMLALPVLLAAYLRSVENEAKAARERAAEAERRRELAEQATRMAERTAIARELHDIVAHHMASIVLRVGVARHVFSDAPKQNGDSRIGEVLDDVHGSAATALADLRRLLAALRADPGRDLGAMMTDPGDLPATLAGVVDSTERAGVKVDAEVGADLTRLDAVRALTVLRLVQEGMTNVVKHAGPGAAVRLEVAADEEGAVRVELENDLPDGTSSLGAGHGLPGMRERVELAGGTLTVGPSSGGWRLAALLPSGGAA